MAIPNAARSLRLDEDDQCGWTSGFWVYATSSKRQSETQTQ